MTSPGRSRYLPSIEPCQLPFCVCSFIRVIFITCQVVSQVLDLYIAGKCEWQSNEKLSRDIWKRVQGAYSSVVEPLGFDCKDIFQAWKFYQGSSISGGSLGCRNRDCLSNNRMKASVNISCLQNVSKVCCQFSPSLGIRFSPHRSMCL